MRIAYIDTETTGLDPRVHEMIEIAILDDTGEWSTKIRPVHIDVAEPEALAVNGYSPERWAGAPLLATVAPEIAARLSGHDLLCGHNVAFDRAFVVASLERAGIATDGIAWRTLDTMTLAHEHLVPGLRSLSLDAIRRHLGWPMEGAHSALQDARDARRLHQMLTRATWLDRLRWRWGAR